MEENKKPQTAERLLKKQAQAIKNLTSQIQILDERIWELINEQSGRKSLRAPLLIRMEFTRAVIVLSLILGDLALVYWVIFKA